MIKTRKIKQFKLKVRLKIIDFAITPLLTEKNWNEDDELILSHNRSVCYNFDMYEYQSFESYFEYSFGFMNTRILNIAYNDQILKDFDFLCSNEECSQSLELLNKARSIMIPENKNESQIWLKPLSQESKQTILIQSNEFYVQNKNKSSMEDLIRAFQTSNKSLKKRLENEYFKQRKAIVPT